MKITYIINSIAILAGTERILVDKMNYLSKHGYDVYIITFEQGNHAFSFELEKNIKHYDLNTRFFTLYKYSIFKRIYLHQKMNIKFNRELENIINDIKPNLFICNTYSIHNFKQILKAVKPHCKVILESHVSLPFLLEDNIHGNDIIIKIIRAYVNHKNMKFIKYFDRIVVLTKQDGLYWRKYSQNISIITNSITNYPKEFNSLVDSHKIICVGRLEPQKGFDLLIKAWTMINQNHKDWYIEIYGEGYLKEFLDNEIIKCNVSNSIFIKEPTRYIYKEYMNSEFLVLSSRAEGFGLVLAEAMSCGRPCVSFNCPCGPDEIITDGVDGLLAKNGDVDDLAEKMEWMITHDKERKEMGIRARESAKRYDKEKIMTQWINLFNELTNNTNI